MNQVMKNILKLMLILLTAGCLNSSDSSNQPNKSSVKRATLVEGNFKSKDGILDIVTFTKGEGNSYIVEFGDGNKVIGNLYEHTLNLPMETKFVFSEDYNEVEHFHLDGSSIYYRIEKDSP